MMSIIFEDLAKIKDASLTKTTENWDGIIDAFQAQIFELEYYYEGWSIKLTGESTIADLQRPSGLPMGEKIDNNLWKIRATISIKPKLSAFVISSVQPIFKRLTHYKVTSDNEEIARKLANIESINRLYNVDYRPSSRIAGFDESDIFVIESNFGTEKNHKEILLETFKVYEDIIDRLEF